MANPEHMSKLLEGVTAWNEWRVANPEIVPNLDGTDFMSGDRDIKNLVTTDSKTGYNYLNFSQANFGETRMKSVNVYRGKFVGANFRKAELVESHFISCDFFGAKLES